jgi:SAM-dependent methyltransferase
LSTNFYRTFEDKLRGPRAMIKSRFMVYLPFVELLKTSHKDCSAVDLGCGRGEWLELLREVGIVARGVDLDDGMLAACRELNLNVETGDALAFLKSLADESQSIVSGFHIIEHIPFNDLQILVQEALRVLKPAGLLLLETPNPENIVVATSNFYLDPTHLHPIPHPLLAFLTEYSGFYQTKVLRLQEAPELATRITATLLDVLGGVSPDYAIVAQKKAPQDILAVFDRVFGEEHGLTIENLASRYDARGEQMVHDLGRVQTDLAGVRADLGGVRTDLAGVRADLVGVRAERDQLQANLNEAFTELEQMRMKREEALTEREGIRVERDQLQANLNEAFTELEQMRMKREEALTEREQIRVKFINIAAELDAKRVEADNLRREYVNILFSKSYRFTAPLRTLYVLLQSFRDHSPLIANKYEGKKEAVPQLSTVPVDFSAFDEDEKHYFNLFQREIAKRRNLKDKK